ncbi:MAG: TetR/AcrR family transcriptional regulator [Planctomycetes bacterium]|nr:TetR/AcrR family transcriptional regulator [Planctomycetota bacterium]
MKQYRTDTRARLTKVARSLLSVHGCDGTALDDVLVATGVSKGAFYHYFKTKDSLCMEVLTDVIAEYKKLCESVDKNLDPVAQLRFLVTKLIELNASGQWVNCRLILKFSAEAYEGKPMLQQKIQEFWDWYTNFYGEIVKQAQAAGQFRNDIEPAVQGRLLTTLMAGSITLEKVPGPDVATIDLMNIVIESLKPRAKDRMLQD